MTPILLQPPRTNVRIIPGLALALLLWPVAPAAAADYGQKLCTEHLSTVPIDCACAGPMIEAEFDEGDAKVVLQVLGIMASGDDMPTMERKFKALEDEHGKPKLDELGKRYEKIGLEPKCTKK
jgi:hypothetical protein